MTERRFVYKAINAEGRLTSQAVDAPTRADAVHRATQLGLTIVELREAQIASPPRRKKLTRDHAVLLLRQMAVMIGAGVHLLEAIETLASSLPHSEAEERLRLVSQSLRRGERLGDAWEAALPIYPAYVYGLIRAGDASGRLPRVLEEAATHLEFSRRVERDIASALTYPTFLVLSGAASVGFLLYAVVPRFALMLESSPAAPSGLSRFVLDAGLLFEANALTILVIIATTGIALFALLQTSAMKAAVGELAHATPGVRQLLMARQRATWSRVVALSLDAGVGILDAISLSAGALAPGALKRAALSAIPALRSGRPIDTAFRDAGAISEIDASLLRAGQSAGALGRMFHAIADRHEGDLRDAVKRLTVIIEPLAIATVALMVGAIVLALASALVGVYETIG